MSSVSYRSDLEEMLKDLVDVVEQANRPTSGDPFGLFWFASIMILATIVFSIIAPLVIGILRRHFVLGLAATIACAGVGTLSAPLVGLKSFPLSSVLLTLLTVRCSRRGPQGRTDSGTAHVGPRG